MWYQANPHEVGPGEQPDYELRCTDSVDGITDWSPPQVFAGPDEGFFDNTLAHTSTGWVMILARGSNLHATSDFPAQGLWWTTAPTASADWTVLVFVESVLGRDSCECAVSGVVFAWGEIPQA